MKLCLPSLGLAFSALAAADPRLGQHPPREIIEQAKPALEEGRRALIAKDAAAVRTAVLRAIEALGPWAGNPETATRYFPTTDHTAFDPGGGASGG